MRVVVDAMGSDRAPGPEVAGALQAVRAHDGGVKIDVTLVGDAALLDAELARAGRTDSDRVRVHHASEVITMDDHPGQAFRSKPDSSMRVAVQLVHAGDGDAVVSAGNSGALLACAMLVLGRLPGVDRPAIVTVLPTPAGPLVLCDAGANTEPKASQLAQFALLGAAYDRAVHGRTPRVGLLSNGAEPGKGTPLTREAHALLQVARGAFQYIGYVEGSDLFRGVVDVIATDGFTGNIVLKICEGITEGMGPPYVDYTEIGGALLAGVTRPAVIAHGRSDANAIASAIRAGAQFAERSLPGQLAAAISALG